VSKHKIAEYVYQFSEFREIYCNDCKKMLARYNVKYYTEDMIAELIQTVHVVHTRGGHHIKIHKKKSGNS